MRFVYQGVPGSYSHQASLALGESLGFQLDCVGLQTFDDVWGAIEEETRAVLPIENSYAGSVHINMYRFLRYPYEVITDLTLPIEHCLLATHSDPDQITTVYSHRQALEQCHSFCKEHGYVQEVRHDTAGAAASVAERNDPTKAALASSLAAELYQLDVVAARVQDTTTNQTRFLLVGPKGVECTVPAKEKMILLFSARNGQGILYKCLGAFATHGIDLTKIESLPSQQDPFTYMFWVECYGHPEDEMVQEMLKELAFFTKEIRLVGAF